MPDAHLDAELLKDLSELPALLHAVESVEQTLRRGRVATWPPARDAHDAG